MSHVKAILVSAAIAMATVAVVYRVEALRKVVIGS
jgi:hypothetical protein